LAPGPFLLFPPPESPIASADSNRYAKVTVQAAAGSQVAIEQFDASATRTLVGFGQGWHEQEFDPRLGTRWRWMSDRAELHLTPHASAVTLHIEGESPLKYFAKASRLTIRSGDRTVLDEVLSTNFARDVRIESGERLVLETDQVYVPAERSGRTQDRRRLGLRIFSLSVTPAS
jgi:hypothetical protein